MKNFSLPEQKYRRRPEFRPEGLFYALYWGKDGAPQTMADGENRMIRYEINPLVDALATPPIAEVQSWIRRPHGPDLGPLLDVSQPVPSYGPARALLDHMAEQIEDPATALYGAFANIDMDHIPLLVDRLVSSQP